MKQYSVFLDFIPDGSTVLDAGCGEGILSVMLAKRGCTVVGTDISEPNIVAAKAYAASQGVHTIDFKTADIEHLPFEDRSFDYVVSSHVLEHIPHFEAGASELARVAKKKVLIAIPTCLSATSMTLLGGDKYWTISRKTLYGLPLGFLRVLGALFTLQDGVNEGYEGHDELIHISRFPWNGKKALERSGLTVERYFGSTYVLPYSPFLLPIAWVFEKMATWPFLRNFGYGTTYVCAPQAS